MRSKAIGCPTWPSLFRGFNLSTTDSAERDVTLAIYLGGRADGAAGLEVVAFVIQNRCHSVRFPNDPRSVVLAGGEQFAYVQQADRRLRPAIGERQLLAESRRLASRLVPPPHRLPGEDPTGGALSFDPRGPAALLGAGADAGRAQAEAPGTAGRPPAPPPATGAAQSSAPAEASVDNASEDGLSTEDPSRPTLPQRSRRPFFFFRDRGAVNPVHPQLAAAPGPAPPPPAPAPAVRPSSPAAGAVQSWSSTSSSPTSVSPFTTAVSSAAEAMLSAGSTGRPAGGRHYGNPAAAPSPTAAPAPARSAQETERIPWPINYSMGSPSSSSSGAPSSLIGGVIGGASSSSNASPAPLFNARLLAREARAGRASPHTATGHHHHFGGGFSARAGRGMLLETRPFDDDGYHDVILPCGLFQDEVIEMMYRDLKPEDFETLNKLDERLPKKNIVQRNLVDRLPRRLARDCDCQECGVCLAELDVLARVVQLPCGHGFHPACISRWLTQCKNMCPLCFQPIDELEVWASSGELAAEPPAQAAQGAASGSASSAPAGEEPQRRSQVTQSI